MPTARFSRFSRMSAQKRSPRLASVLTAGAIGLGATALALPSGAGAVPPGGPKTKSNGAKVTLSTTSVKAGGRIKVTGSNWKS